MASRTRHLPTEEKKNPPCFTLQVENIFSSIQRSHKLYGVLLGDFQPTLEASTLRHASKTAYFLSALTHRLIPPSHVWASLKSHFFLVCIAGRDKHSFPLVVRHAHQLLTSAFRSISAPAPGPSCPSCVSLPLWWWWVWLHGDAFGSPAPPAGQTEGTGGWEGQLCINKHPVLWASLKTKKIFLDLFAAPAKVKACWNDIAGGQLRLLANTNVGCWQRWFHRRPWITRWSNANLTCGNKWFKEQQNFSTATCHWIS